jgi:hypothetical protein
VADVKQRQKREDMNFIGRMARSCGYVSILLLYFPLGALSGGRLDASVTDLEVQAVPIQLDRKNPTRSRFGELVFLAGFELRSTDPRFGGLSGLASDQTGRGLFIVSDRGRWLSVELNLGADGSLIGFGAWRIGPLPPFKRKPLGRHDRDAEAIARTGDGSYLVAFEHNHRLWRYQRSPAGFIAAPIPLEMPAELLRAPMNGGLEGVTVLPDGKILTLTEKYKDGSGYLKGWSLWGGDIQRVAYQQSEGFSPTDLATSATGDIYVLERRYELIRGPGARILEFPRLDVESGLLSNGRELLRLEPPLTLDNFEGLTTHKDNGSEEVFYLLSDNNFSTLQRTLLLQFRMRAP